MPTLAQLKAKWFIPIDGSAPDGVPRRRHTTPGDPYAIAESTDGNTVTRLIDGKVYMTEWRSLLRALHNQQGAEMYHTGWRFEGVRTLGASDASSDALELINEADENAVLVRVLLSDHLSGLNLNQLTSTWLLAHGVLTLLDNRYPAGGSNHFKFAVFKTANDASAVVGSIDISKSRWDDELHLVVNTERDPTYGKQTHDLGVKVKGPAVTDLELIFRERWNDPGYNPLFPDITTPVSATVGTGTHSIQVLRTYGISDTLAYSFSTRGEFTVWASYLNAIKQASTYIYIEDQYFLPFDWPPAFSRSGLARETDLVYQLGEAIKRGVRVFVLTPSNAEDIGKGKSKYHRDLGLNYLRLVKTAGAPGQFVVASLSEGVTSIYVHSKLMIVDDEVAFIGSANFSQRSMTCDGEVQLAIVDSAELFARDLRVALWSEHLGTAVSNDPVTAYVAMADGVTNTTGRLRPYMLDYNAVYPAGSTQPERGHSTWMRSVFDPYFGPPTLR